MTHHESLALDFRTARSDTFSHHHCELDKHKIPTGRLQTRLRAWPSRGTTPPVRRRGTRASISSARRWLSARRLGIKFLLPEFKPARPWRDTRDGMLPAHITRRNALIRRK